MPDTFQVLGSTTVGSGITSINFSSIPQTYTDIYMALSIRGATSGAGIYCRLNGDSANNYYGKLLESNAYSGGIYSSSRTSDACYIGESSEYNYAANYFSNGSVYFPNYSDSTQKTYSAENSSENTTNTWITMFAGRWDSTAAITSMSVFLQGGATFASGSTVSIYGILKGTGGANAS